MPPHTLKRINKILIANRGEIAIRIFRAATELNIKTVAIYTYADRYSLHRYKADESYLIGRPDDPLKPYLDIEGIIKLAKDKLVDAIHPGYGFLSENVQFAKRCREEGIVFVGPSPEAMEALGNKILGKQAAEKCGVPTIPGAEVDVSDLASAAEQAEKVGFPIMVKAASGGGGRGMRIVRSKGDLNEALETAGREAEAAFGDPTVFIERFVEDPKHIEVQLLGDQHGNLLHLYERDCSVQRRYQKVVEVAPSFGLKDKTRQNLYKYALALGKLVNYDNAGTVEFLVDKEENIYFIEVNPRVQVEHTVTEEITKIDIVRSQILIAQGHALSDEQIFLKDQKDIQIRGFAIQCRITTEDPEQDFRPDTGTVIAYRNAAGFGIRLDEGNLYTGVTISPYFDSLLVKVSASGRTLKGASRRLVRALREFRIRGVKTNTGFLENVLTHPDFYNGKANVGFIGQNPQLLKVPVRFNRGTRVLQYLGHTVVNGNPDLAGLPGPGRMLPIALPDIPPMSLPKPGTRQLLVDNGPEMFAKHLFQQKAVAITDTALRDAHQSLFATRMRTADMLAIAPAYTNTMRDLFALETWGGATFDVALRFLKEDPWDRLSRMREAIPNILFRMLLRGRNAVGYGFYSMQAIELFILEAWKRGIDIFRVFDSFNQPQPVVDCIKVITQNTSALAEACVCYSGNLGHPDEKKFTLDYYLRLAEPMVEAGAHMLCIKDMAGLIKPKAAEILVPALRDRFGLPVILHTHDTSSVQSTALLAAVNAGVDSIDLAIASLSGLTSQPNLNSMLSILDSNERKPNIDLEAANRISDYFEAVRTMYAPYEPEMKAGTAEVYENEIPGGQYSNLRGQARSLGLEEEFAQVRKNYQGANSLLGRIIKVTPSSKAVGDMALFMTANGLTEQNFYEGAPGLAFPESVKSLVNGELGTPLDGWPEGLEEAVLGEASKRKSQPPAEEITEAEFQKRFPSSARIHSDYLSYLMYPKVFEEYYKFREEFGEVWYLATPTFLYGLKRGEETIVTIGAGKDIIVKLIDIADELDSEGRRAVTFDLNGQNRIVNVVDEAATKSGKVRHRIMAQAEGDVGAPMPGRVSSILVEKGQAVEEGQPLFTLEAMKMESNVTAKKAGTVQEIAIKAGETVVAGELILKLG